MSVGHVLTASSRGGDDVVVCMVVIAAEHEQGGCAGGLDGVVKAVTVSRVGERAVRWH